jgi:hypothetical protein
MRVSIHCTLVLLVGCAGNTTDNEDVRRRQATALDDMLEDDAPEPDGMTAQATSEDTNVEEDPDDGVTSRSTPSNRTPGSSPTGDDMVDGEGAASTPTTTVVGTESNSPSVSAPDDGFVPGIDPAPDSTPSDTDGGAASAPTDGGAEPFSVDCEPISVSGEGDACDGQFECRGVETVVVTCSGEGDGTNTSLCECTIGDQEFWPNEQTPKEGLEACAAALPHCVPCTVGQGDCWQPRG